MEHVARRPEDFNSLNPVGIFVGPMMTMYEEITTRGLKDLMSAGREFYLLSIQDEPAYEKGHICDSLNIALADVERDVRSLIGKDDLVVVYGSGRSSATSAVGADKLRTLGYTRILRYTGGLKEWKETGQCVEGVPEETLFDQKEAA